MPFPRHYTTISRPFLPTAIESSLETEVLVSELRGEATITQHGISQSRPLVAAATSVAGSSLVSVAKYSIQPGAAALIGYMARQRLLHRPIRTLIMVIAIAVEVTFVVLVAAIAAHLLDVLTLMAVIAGFLATFLSICRATIGRTYEVGVLKTLGAPKRYIVGIFLAESIFLCLAGTFAGVGLSYPLQSILSNVYHSLPIVITYSWIVRAGLTVTAGGLLGTASAAWLASCKDPAEILPHD